MLIHKMIKANPNEKKVSVSESWSKNVDEWPILINPYVPKNSQPDKNGNIWPTGGNPYVPKNNSNVWNSPIMGSGTTFGCIPPQDGIVTAESVKKKAELKKYRSIDDPWETT